jgi:hypothetical protein
MIIKELIRVVTIQISQRNKRLWIMVSKVGRFTVGSKLVIDGKNNDGKDQR